MAVDFYTKWLDVPPGPRPPDYYTLLGIELFCDDLDAIEQATRRQLTRLDSVALHPDRKTREAVQNMMNEVARARVDLVNPNRRPDYDRQLAQQLGVVAPGEPEPQPVELEETAPQPQPAVEEVVDLAAQFETVVWKHLRKWKLNAHEQRLLLAEAAALGVADDDALSIIERMDHEAEILAEKKHKLQIGITIGLSAAAVIGVILFAIFSQRTDSPNDQNTQVAIDTGKPKPEPKPKPPDRKLTDKPKPKPPVSISPEPTDPVVKDPSQAEAMRKKLAAERELRFRQAVSAMSASMKAGKLHEASQSLSEAKAALPGNPRLEALRRELTRKLRTVAIIPEPTVINIHAGSVKSIAFSPDSRRIVSGGLDKTVKIWDVASRRDVTTINGRSNYVYSVAFSPDGKHVVSGDQDKVARIWDAATGRLVGGFRGHNGSVVSLAYSPDGSRIASGDVRFIVKIWDAATGREITSIKGLGCKYSVVFSPDGKRIAAANSEDVKIWDIASGREVMTSRDRRLGPVV